MKYQDMWDLPLSKYDLDKQSFKKRISHVTSWIVYIVVGALMKLIFRLTTKQREHIRELLGKSGAVIIAPHVSYLDPVALWLSARPQQFIRFMAKDDLFTQEKGLTRKLLGWLISAVGAFPIKRDSADKAAIKRAVAMLKRGELVGIFPEGTRRGKGNLQPTLHGGAMLIARMAHVPVVAVGIRGLVDAHDQKRHIWFPKIEVVYSKPISLETFNFLPKEDRLAAAMWYVMRKSFALSRNIPDEEVDMNILFPGSRDFSSELSNLSSEMTL